eukprot:8197695-Karenia_brevis.AAC.1
MSGTAHELAFSACSLIEDVKLPVLVRDALIWLLDNQYILDLCDGTHAYKVNVGSGMGLRHS